MRNHQSPHRSPGGRQLNNNWGSNKETSWMRAESRDEDLALFQDMRTRERKNFLHPSNDDIEASLSTKFGGLTGYRIPSPTPPRKGHNDLLTVDAEKNDYDWLLTPPGTPLFPSLDQDSPLIHDLERSVHRQPHSVSKASRLSVPQARETQNKVLRGSPSPRRPSTASSTSSSNSMIRGGASSPSRISLSPTARPSTPSRQLQRASTTLNKASIRSSPTTLRRLNTSPSVRSSSTERSGSSKTRTRGTSVSPKLQARLPPEVVLSLETPPNLRTSISEHPVIATRNGTSSSRHGIPVEARHSYSEAADVTRSRWRNVPSFGSRSCSSSNSQDHWSSKGSVISSSDDGIEISQPAGLDCKDERSDYNLGDANVTARFDEEVNSRFSPPVKRPVRSMCTSAVSSALSSTPTRKSLEPSMRQMDHRRIPQNMFRPLLSSAPTASFYDSGHLTIQHRPASPIADPSITASSNASSEQGVKIAPGDESSDEEERGNESEWGKSPSRGDVMNKIVVDGELRSPEYIDVLHGKYSRHDYDNDQGQDGVSISSPMAADNFGRDDGCKMNKVTIENNPDWTGQHPFSERIWTSTTTNDHGRKNCSLATQFPIYEFDYGSVDGDSTGLSSQRDLAISPRSEEPADQLFVDIQEDLSVQCYGNKFQDALSTDLQIRLLYSLEKPESQPIEISQTIRASCDADKESFRESIHTVEHESVNWSPQGQIGLLRPKESNNSSDAQLCQPTDLGMDHPRDQSIHESDTSVIICKSNVSSGHRSEEHGARLRSELRIDSQMVLNKPPVVTHVEVASDRHDSLELERGASLVRGDCLVIDARPVERENSATVAMDSSCQFDLSCCPKRLVFTEGEAESSVFSSPTASNTRIFGKEEWERYSCGDPGFTVKREFEVATPSSQREEGFVDPSDLVSDESCREYFIDFVETTEDAAFKMSETIEFSRSPKKHFFVNSPVSSGYYIPIEERESPQASLTANLDVELSPVDKVASLDLNPKVTMQKESEDNNTCMVADSEVLGLDAHCKKDVSMIVSVTGLCTDNMDEADRISRNGMICKDTVEISGAGVEPELLNHNQLLESISSPGDGSFVQSFSLDEVQENEKFSNSDSNSSIGQNLYAISTHDNPHEPSTPANSAVLLQGIEEQPNFKASPHTTSEHSVQKPVTRNFTLEEATDTILFCSSIVHDIVYSAASIATAKELSASAVLPYPAGAQSNCGVPSTDYRNSYKGKVSKSGNWKSRPREAISAARRSLTYQQSKEENIDETPAIMIHPAPIDGMRSDESDSEKDAVKIRNEKSQEKLSVSSNCQCIIM